MVKDNGSAGGAGLFRSALRDEEVVGGDTSQGFAALHPGLFSFPPYGRNFRARQNCRTDDEVIAEREWDKLGEIQIDDRERRAEMRMRFARWER